MNRAADVLLPPDASVRQALECLNRTGKGIVLVVDAEQKLVGTITDGDIRRAALAGGRLDQPVTDTVLRRDPSSPHKRPVTARAGAPASELLDLMRRWSVRHVPLLDESERVVDLALLSDLVLDTPPPLGAVVMAGGLGTRLRPLTETLPKPMLPVGDRPVMEHVLAQLQHAGISEVSITTHYKGEAIKEHFGDGARFGLHINYVTESEPMGTAGALGLMAAPEQTMLVINGDILTDVDFRAMHAYHVEQRALMTVGLRQYEVEVPYGVVETDGALVSRLTEKPSYRFFVNAGVYLIEPGVFQRIQPGQHLDATDLIEQLVADGKRVAGFPIHEYWLDIGRPDDYRRANEEWRHVDA